MKGLSSRAIIGIFYEKLAAIVGASWVGGVSMDFFDSDMRSEERRVGKECRSRWSPYH